jgi:hypothetical protein
MVAENAKRIAKIVVSGNFLSKQILTQHLGNSHPHYFSSKPMLMGFETFTKNTSGCGGYG